MTDSYLDAVAAYLFECLNAAFEIMASEGFSSRPGGWVSRVGARSSSDTRAARSRNQRPAGGCYPDRTNTQLKSEIFVGDSSVNVLMRENRP